MNYASVVKNIPFSKQRKAVRAIKTLRLLMPFVTSSLMSLSACSPLLQEHPVHITPTRVFSANIVGQERNPAIYCAPDAPPNIPGPHAIFVRDPALLDDLCILGFRNRVQGSAGQVPDYLRTIYPHLSTAPSAKTDIVFDTGPQANTPQITYIGNRSWQERLSHLAHYLHVEKTAQAALDDYLRYAEDTSRRRDTKNTEVSLLTITKSGMKLLGRKGFIADVLHTAHVGRPDRVDHDSPQPITLSSLAKAEADLIYISYVPGYKSHVVRLLTSSEWKKLGASYQQRQFIVNYSWWNQGKGLIAARSIIDDVRNSINTTSMS